MFLLFLFRFEPKWKFLNLSTWSDPRLLEFSASLRIITWIKRTKHFAWASNFLFVIQSSRANWLIFLTSGLEVNAIAREREKCGSWNKLSNKFPGCLFAFASFRRFLGFSNRTRGFDVDEAFETRALLRKKNFLRCAALKVCMRLARKCKTVPVYSTPVCCLLFTYRLHYEKSYVTKHRLFP